MRRDEWGDPCDILERKQAPTCLGCSMLRRSAPATSPVTVYWCRRDARRPHVTDIYETERCKSYETWERA
jgi:hypothetical protein